MGRRLGSLAGRFADKRQTTEWSRPLRLSLSRTISLMPMGFSLIPPNSTDCESTPKARLAQDIGVKKPVLVHQAHWVDEGKAERAHGDVTSTVVWRREIMKVAL